MSETPQVSVIMGVYNKEKYVGECLRSVLTQTYPSFELIVVDDCSTDGSVAEIQKIQDERIRFVQRPTNSGHPGITRNQAIRMARGAFLAFLDADDVWLPEKLEKQVAYMEAHPEFPFTHTQCMVIDGDGQEINLRHEGKYPPSGDCFLALVTHLFICTSTVMIQKTLTEQIGLFSEEPCFKSGQDYEFFIRCARVASMGMPEGVLALYRSYPDTTSRKQDGWGRMPRNFYLHRIFLRRKSLWEGRAEEATMRNIAYTAADESAYFWRQKEYKDRAVWFAWQMICLKPFRTGGWRQLLATLVGR